MVVQFKIPWTAWYGDQDLILEFPNSWDIKLFSINDGKELSLYEVENAINNPIGTLRLQEIAKGKKSAVITVENISRPAKLENILKIILKQLNNAGIANEKITLIFAVGAHRPLTRQDAIKKVGLSVVESINVENHHPYENLIYVSASKKGTPIYLNKTYHEAEVKVAVGSVIPHPLAGFTGGAKIILPGVCGIQTLEANHNAGVRGVGIGFGIVTELRKDIEDVCEKAGLDFTINVVPNAKRGIVGVFAGHFVEAHRKAMELAKKMYLTEIPQDIKFDVCFFNLYPEDTELAHAIKGINFYVSSKKFIKRDGAIVLLTAASEGRGFHSLQGETGAKLYQNWGNTIPFSAILKKMTFGCGLPILVELMYYIIIQKELSFENISTKS